ncbi:hypothetical protein C1H46_016536 [Malus baccata]|uniref:Uncharacterized protein n=1 Tax=Malus baccata TaxID=106549 RepID=A0A540MGK5_MALBA|nr:hypothetical protein C1H46_016536 [Malus baccata]
MVLDLLNPKQIPNRAFIARLSSFLPKSPCLCKSKLQSVESMSQCTPSDAEAQKFIDQPPNLVSIPIHRSHLSPMFSAKTRYSSLSSTTAHIQAILDANSS